MYVHGMLDRFAGLQLLTWGKEGLLAKAYDTNEQKKFIAPLRNILNMSGCYISFSGTEIIAKRRNREKNVVVYPAMWVEPREADTIFVSDAYIKYAKPYAVQKILDEV